MKLFVGFLVAFAFFSCQSSHEENEKEHLQNEASYFSHFPEHPFLNLCFNEELEKQKELLKSKGFEFNESLSAINQEEITVILEETDKLNNFKVLFLNQKPSFFEETCQFFEKNASKSDKNDHFATFEIRSQKDQYSVSVFEFNQLVRLHYKLKSTH